MKNWFREQRQTYKRGARIVALMCTVALALGVIIALTLDVAEKQRRLQTANSDSVIWTLSQLEVEYLKFARELEHVAASGPDAEGLAALRQSFDIFYSRVNTVSNAEALRKNIGTADAKEYFDQILALLDASIPLIDGDDLTLIDGLHHMIERDAALAPIVREVSLINLQNFVAVATVARESVLGTMQLLGILTFGMILILTGLAIALFLMVGVNERIAKEQSSLAARLQTILDTSLDAVLVVDSNGDVLEFNDAAETIFGFSVEEAMGKPLTDLIIPDEFLRAHTIGMERYKRSGEKRLAGRGRFEIEAKRKDNSRVLVELSIETAETSQGEVFVSFIRDISQRKAAEQELVEARDKALAGERTKSRFLAIMSHEMRTPLNGLVGMLDLLRRTPMDEKQEFYVQNMDFSGRVLIDLINNVLDLAKLETDDDTLKQTGFDPERLIQEVLSSQIAVARQNAVHLSYEWIGDAVPGVVLDRGRLRQILLNLVNNAIKFTRNGDVIVEAEILPPVTRDGKPEFELRVIDTGCGIPEEAQTRVFDDFETVENDYDRTTEGTGLGLGIVRRLVHLMRGQVGVESELGDGSLFWVRLPVTIAEPDEDTAVFAPQSKPARPSNLLMVEDNEINRRVLREMLESEGHSVSEAHDGKEGVEAAKHAEYDAILMDISMPGMAGVTATEHIRAATGPNQGTPIIAVTAHAMPNEIDSFTKAGMNDVLNKPVMRHELNQALGRWVGFQDDTATPTRQGPTQDEDNYLLALARDLPADDLAGLAKRFIEETDTTIREINALASDPSRRADITAQVHKTAGSAGSFGLSTFHAALAAAQTALKSDPEYDVPTSMADLAMLWIAGRQEVIDTLQKLDIQIDL